MRTSDEVIGGASEFPRVPRRLSRMDLFELGRIVADYTLGTLIVIGWMVVAPRQELGRRVASNG